MWDIGHYFNLAKFGLDKQVYIMMMHLMADTKLLWQIDSKEDLNARNPKIET